MKNNLINPVKSININYYKAVYQVCKKHTGYNNGHDSNVYGFERLSYAIDFAKSIKKNDSVQIFTKDFGARNPPPCNHKIDLLMLV